MIKNSKILPTTGKNARAKKEQDINYSSVPGHSSGFHHTLHGTVYRKSRPKVTAVSPQPLGGMLYKGDYNVSTAYTVNDCVTHNQGFYICIRSGTGQNPELGVYWILLATRGLLVT